MVADARRRWPLWTILGGAVSAQILMIAALVMIYLALDLDPLVLEAGQILGGLYLIWLGCDGLCGGGGETTTPRRSEAHYFWRAMAVGLSIQRTSCSSSPSCPASSCRRSRSLRRPRS